MDLDVIFLGTEDDDNSVGESVGKQVLPSVMFGV